MCFPGAFRGESPQDRGFSVLGHVNRAEKKRSGFSCRGRKTIWFSVARKPRSTHDMLFLRTFRLGHLGASGGLGHGQPRRAWETRQSQSWVASLCVISRQLVCRVQFYWLEGLGLASPGARVGCPAPPLPLRGPAAERGNGERGGGGGLGPCGRRLPWSTANLIFYLKNSCAQEPCENRQLCLIV